MAPKSNKSVPSHPPSQSLAQDDGDASKADIKKSDHGTAKSSAFAKGDLDKKPELETHNPTIAEWCLDQWVLLHQLTTTDISVSRDERYATIVDDWKKLFEEPRIPDQFLSNLTNGDTTGRTAKGAARPTPGYEDFYRATTVWGGEGNLIRLARTVANHAKRLRSLPQATVGNEAEWRARTWDRILIDMEEHLFDYEPVSKDGKSIGNLPFNVEVLRYFQERSIQYPRSVGYDELHSGKSPKPHDSFYSALCDHLDYLDDIEKHFRASNGKVQVGFDLVRTRTDETKKALDDLGQKMAAAAHTTGGEPVTRESYKLAMKNRLLKYPKRGTSDAGFHLVSWKPMAQLIENHKWKRDQAAEVIRNFQSMETPKVQYKLGTPLVYPLFITEKKRDTQSSFQQACNQRLMYCVGASRGLGALGIHNFPVYGLATYGANGTIASAWCSQHEHEGRDTVEVVNYAFNDTWSNVNFNLANEGDVVRFIIVTLRIVMDMGERLHKEANAAEEDFGEHMKALLDPLASGHVLDKQHGWPLSSQIDQYKWETKGNKGRKGVGEEEGVQEDK